MKKLDLHIHTVKTISDSDFEFSLDVFEHYVTAVHLDVVAVTNHNVFDSSQYRQIQQHLLPVQTLPGIEINVGSGHLLLISDGADLASFEDKCAQISDRIQVATDSVTPEQLIAIFGDLSDYLLIPHYGKSPAIRGPDFTALERYFSAGEVDSAKKFVRAMRNSESLCPVLFSDSRMKQGMEQLPTRQTFINCGEISLAAIKSCLSQKDKVFLSEKDGNKLFQVFDDGQHISTGLNVILGERSSGKTYTLNRLKVAFDNIKYVKQFDLVQSSEEDDLKKFNGDLQRQRSRFVDDYLSGFRAVLDDVSKVDAEQDDKKLAEYVGTLLKSATEADRRDSFSKVKLYDEVQFSVSGNEGLKKLISSVIHLIENVEYRDVIESHVQLAHLRALAVDLINRLWAKADDDRKRVQVNSIVRDVKDRLRMRTSATHVEPVDFYSIALNSRKITRFNEIARALQSAAPVYDEPMQGFRIVATKGPYTQASEMSDAIKGKAAFKEALRVYADPYKFLRVLMQHEKLDQADIHKLFVRITYRILNKEGNDVSGGERSEFRLLQEIRDAQRFDMLLLDEPESSFDNKFLNSDVNDIIKCLSKEMPVVVVTHNNNIGASINPDYVLYAQKEVIGRHAKYRLFTGYPTDKDLVCIDGMRVRSHDILLDSLEAGPDAYEGRRQIYAVVKD